jgi:hypothetical protein
VQVSRTTFVALTGGTDPTWVLRLEVGGTDFVARAAPVVATVGPVPVEFIFLNVDGDGFTGLLRTFPADGAQVRVGYLDTGLTDTGFIYSSLLV